MIAGGAGLPLIEPARSGKGRWALPHRMSPRLPKEKNACSAHGAHGPRGHASTPPGIHTRARRPGP